MQTEAVTAEPDRADPFTNLGARQLARRVLTAFLLTFIAARLLVILIMARKIPDLFLHVGGTHVHHLNYGIFLLAGVGGFLLFRPQGHRRLLAMLYGIGLALTFDEFGIWLRLGGSYWQRASWDAVCVIAAGLALFAYGPALARYRPRHWITAILLTFLVAGFFYALSQSLAFAGKSFGPRLQRLEESSPP